MATGDEEALRQRAEQRLKKKAEFRSHLTSYVLVNAALVVIWALTSGPGSYFWPIWPLLGWGVGIGFHAWETYGQKSHGPSEDQIRREMDKLR
ncbi:MAG: 2TM domain-containing protein [Actinomycetota bacterium]